MRGHPNQLFIKYRMFGYVYAGFDLLDDLIGTVVLAQNVKHEF